MIESRDDLRKTTLAKRLDNLIAERDLFTLLHKVIALIIIYISHVSILDFLLRLPSKYVTCEVYILVFNIVLDDLLLFLHGHEELISFQKL